VVELLIVQEGVNSHMVAFCTNIFSIVLKFKKGYK